MDRQEDREIAKKLLSKNILWGDLNDNKKALCRRVYGACKAKLDALSQIEKEFRKNKFSKLSIAQELGVSRKTLGTNNPEVDTLLNVLLEEGRHYWNLSTSSKEDGNIVPILEQRIKDFLKRDCELQEKEEECRSLRKEIEARVRQHEEMKNERDALKKECESLKKEVADRIPFSVSSKGPIKS